MLKKKRIFLTERLASVSFSAVKGEACRYKVPWDDPLPPPPNTHTPTLPPPKNATG